MGEGVAYGGLPFPGTRCPMPHVDNLCLLCIDFYVWDAVPIFNHLPRMFLSTDFAFRITDWTCCQIPHLHAIVRIISRVVSGLATDSPCSVWGRGFICLLHDSPLFGSHFKMRVGMKVLSDISYIYYFLPRFTVSCMTLVFFYSIITFSYTKYFCTLIYCRHSLYSFLWIYHFPWMRSYRFLMGYTVNIIPVSIGMFISMFMINVWIYQHSNFKTTTIMPQILASSQLMFIGFLSTVYQQPMGAPWHDCGSIRSGGHIILKVTSSDVMELFQHLSEK